MDIGCQSGIVRHRQHREQQSLSLRDRAARQAFPDWQPTDADWTHLYTGFDQVGEPVTEVAVYQDHDRIHYARYSGDELTRFWERLIG